MSYVFCAAITLNFALSRELPFIIPSAQKIVIQPKLGWLKEKPFLPRVMSSKQHWLPSVFQLLRQNSCKLITNAIIKVKNYSYVPSDCSSNEYKRLQAAPLQKLQSGHHGWKRNIFFFSGTRLAITWEHFGNAVMKRRRKLTEKETKQDCFYLIFYFRRRELLRVIKMYTAVANIYPFMHSSIHAWNCQAIQSN